MSKEFEFTPLVDKESVQKSSDKPSQGFFTGFKLKWCLLIVPIFILCAIVPVAVYETKKSYVSAASNLQQCLSSNLPKPNYKDSSKNQCTVTPSSIFIQNAMLWNGF